MRRVALGTAVLAATAWAVEGVVHLDGPADLARLRHSNPGHYRQAVQIIDSARELCKSHAGEVEYTKAKNVSCSQMLLRTSNPAKRQISFRLDSTDYVALVTMTEDPPRLVAATSR